MSGDIQPPAPQRPALEEPPGHAGHMELVGRLAVELAHDFNNLLTVIQSYGGLALEGAAEGSELHGDLSEMMRAARRAGALSHQLVTFGRRAPQVRLVDVNQELEHASALLRRLAGAGVALTFAPDPDLWPVTTDAAQLTRVAAELVLAARDAGPADAPITIATANRAMAAGAADVPPGAYVALTVTGSEAGQDAGPRPAPALRMARDLARRGGGHLRVARGAGGEVATTLLLPRSEVAPAAASAGDSAAALVPGGAETILLVEDDAAARLAARRALLELGYTVLEAGDGTEALELWAEHAPAIDLVVTGAGLPGGEGRALAARIRAMRADARVLALADGGGPLPSPSGAPAPQRLTADALARRVRSALDRTQ